MAEVATLLGTPLMPWQRHVADVALEIDPETDRLVYTEAVLTVPRQSGKTTLLLAVMVQRALGFGQRQRIVYTAQSRNDARRKWEDEHVRLLEQSPLNSIMRVRRQYGAEAIRWNNGSMHGISAPTEKAGHGDVLDLGVIDEAFAQVDDRMEQAMKPAMITRPEPQQWVVSTAGTVKSTYLREKVEAGRLRASTGVRSSVAYFEWSAPGKADPSDPVTWWGCMPALGRTVEEQAVRGHFETMKLGEFRRAYLNQWPSEAPDEWLVISQQDWQAAVDLNSEPGRVVAFAADATPEQSWGSIAVASKRTDGLMHVEIPEGDHRPGTAWMAERMIYLANKYNPCAVVVDSGGPAGFLVPILEAAGLELAKPGPRDATQACGAFFDAVTDAKTLRHRDQPELASALAGAQKRDLGEAWAWARKGISVDISPLIATTLALWGYATRAHLLEGPYDALESIF